MSDDAKTYHLNKPTVVVDGKDLSSAIRGVTVTMVVMDEASKALAKMGSDLAKSVRRQHMVFVSSRRKSCHHLDTEREWRSVGSGVEVGECSECGAVCAARREGSDFGG